MSLDNVSDGQVNPNNALHNRFAEIKRWHAPNFCLWKRVFAWPFLKMNGQPINWNLEDTSVIATTVVWGGLANFGLNAKIVRMEDGFIHSLGLGSDLSPPCSQVIDITGIYFDSKKNNDLSNLLNSYEFDDVLLKRAANLRQLIVEKGITKYNLGRKKPSWQRTPNQLVILVVGQVADDASVKLGTSGAMNNIDALLAQVWTENPDALIVYKPHPDVMSGNRKGLIEAKNHCHIVDTEADIISLIDNVNEVHTLSSLAGFDALLRGKRVVTYGLPFYAGWGLTEDKISTIPFRERQVSLDVLTAATLILYPIYWDWDTRQFSTPEAIINKLAPHVNRPLVAIPTHKRLLLKGYRWFINLVKYMHLQFQQMIQIKS